MCQYKINLTIFSFLLCNRIKPCDFDYLKIIGKGSFGKVNWPSPFICSDLAQIAVTQTLTQIFALFQVLLARHKESTKYYAVKVLQKKIIMKKKEVNSHYEVERIEIRVLHIL